MRRKKAARNLLSPRVLEFFSRTSLMGECVMQLSVWFDSPQGYSIDINAPHSHSRKEEEEFSRWLYRLDDASLPVDHINPFRGELTYPVDKARNARNVRAMRPAESSLDYFWRCVDKLYEVQTGIEQYEAIRQCIIEGGQMRRTPPWEDSEDMKAKYTQKSEHTYQPFPEMSHNTTIQIIGAFNKIDIEEKIKPKTKGSIDSPIADATAINVVPAVSENNVQQVYNLDKRALKAMETLFHVPQTENDDVPKAVKWNEFKRAMVRIGFSVEKLQGSAWQFNPVDAPGISRSIQFHEPHPDSAIPHTMPKRFGRRLEWVYGWNSDSFRLA